MAVLTRLEIGHWVLFLSFLVHSSFTNTRIEAFRPSSCPSKPLFLTLSVRGGGDSSSGRGSDDSPTADPVHRRHHSGSKKKKKKRKHITTDATFQPRQPSKEPKQQQRLPISSASGEQLKSRKKKRKIRKRQHSDKSTRVMEPDANEQQDDDESSRPKSRKRRRRGVKSKERVEPRVALVVPEFLDEIDDDHAPPSPKKKRKVKRKKRVVPISRNESNQDVRAAAVAAPLAEPGSESIATPEDYLQPKGEPVVEHVASEETTFSTEQEHAVDEQDVTRHAIVPSDTVSEASPANDENEIPEQKAPEEPVAESAIKVSSSHPEEGALVEDYEKSELDIREEVSAERKDLDEEVGNVEAIGTLDAGPEDVIHVESIEAAEDELSSELKAKTLVEESSEQSKDIEQESDTITSESLETREAAPEEMLQQEITKTAEADLTVEIKTEIIEEQQTTGIDDASKTIPLKVVEMLEAGLDDVLHHGITEAAESDLINELKTETMEEQAPEQTTDIDDVSESVPFKAVEMLEAGLDDALHHGITEIAESDLTNELNTKMIEEQSTEIGNGIEDVSEYIPSNSHDGLEDSTSLSDQSATSHMNPVTDQFEDKEDKSSESSTDEEVQEEKEKFDVESFASSDDEGAGTSREGLEEAGPDASSDEGGDENEAGGNEGDVDEDKTVLSSTDDHVETARVEPSFGETQLETSTDKIEASGDPVEEVAIGMDAGTGTPDDNVEHNLKDDSNASTSNDDSTSDSDNDSDSDAIDSAGDDELDSDAAAPEGLVNINDALETGATFERGNEPSNQQSLQSLTPEPSNDDQSSAVPDKDETSLSDYDNEASAVEDELNDSSEPASEQADDQLSADGHSFDLKEGNKSIAENVTLEGVDVAEVETIDVVVADTEQEYVDEARSAGTHDDTGDLEDDGGEGTEVVSISSVINIDDYRSSVSSLNRIDLKDLDSTFDDATDIHVSVITWNLAEESPAEEDALFIKKIRKMGDKGSDFVLISGQECENIKPRRTEGHRSREFRRLMIKMLGKNYVPIALHMLGGIQFGLFCKRSILGELEHASIADVTCGIGNVFHNKGAIGAFIQMKARNKEDANRAKSLRMLFVTAHLAAHVKNTDARDADFWRIISELEAQAPPQFLLPTSTDGKSSGSNLLDSMDRIFFCGDLNYRIDLPREEAEYSVLNLEKKPDEALHRQLLRHDQLLASMAEERAFPGFAEGAISFPPTFKFDKGTTEYDTSHKQRIPAWTDRVLFKPNGTRVLEYNSVRDAMHSDHRPVYAIFRVNTQGRPVPPPRKRTKKRRQEDSKDQG